VRVGGEVDRKAELTIGIDDDASKKTGKEPNKIVIVQESRLHRPLKDIQHQMFRLIRS